MSVRDNRITINSAQAVAHYQGTDVGTDETGSGLFYEGTQAVSAQFSNTQEYIVSDVDDAGTAYSLDLSASTVYVLVKDNLADTQANLGTQVVLADADTPQNNIIGFAVAGNDTNPFILPKQYSSLRLDITNRSIYSTQAHNGSAANLIITAINRVGYGSLHAIAARGNVDNLFIDKQSYIANSDYSFTLYGGSASNPVDLDEVTDSDAATANGWGCFTKSGTAYNIFASTLFGDSATGSDGYFSQSNSQIFLEGEGMGAGNFIFGVGGNSGGTQSFVLDNCVVVSKGTPAPFDFSDTNVNTIDIQNTQFIDLDTITFSDSTGVRVLTGDTFINCGQINLKNISASSITINGTQDSATGALLFDSAGCSNSKSDFNITSGGSGHGVYITDVGNYTLTDFNFFGYNDSGGSNLNSNSGSTDAAIYNNSGGSVTISVVGGNTPSVRNGASATTTVENNISITVTNMKDGTEVRIFLTSTLDNTPPYSTPTEIAGVEDLTGGIGTSLNNGTAGGSTDNNTFTFSVSSGTGITIKTFNENWISDNISVVPISTQNVQISQRVDRVFSNP